MTRIRGKNAVSAGIRTPVPVLQLLSSWFSIVHTSKLQINSCKWAACELAWAMVNIIIIGWTLPGKDGMENIWSWPRGGRHLSTQLPLFDIYIISIIPINDTNLPLSHPPTHHLHSIKCVSAVNAVCLHTYPWILLVSATKCHGLCRTSITHFVHSHQIHRST